MRATDKQQHASHSMQQNRVQMEDRAGAGEEVKGQVQTQHSPLAGTGPTAAQIMGGVRLARTPIGKAAGKDLTSGKATAQQCTDRLYLQECYHSRLCTVQQAAFDPCFA